MFLCYSYLTRSGANYRTKSAAIMIYGLTRVIARRRFSSSGGLDKSA